MSLIKPIKYEMFPEVNHGLVPVGSMVLIQLKAPKTHTQGGVLLTGNTQDSEMWNIQVGKVVAIGPLAYRDRKTMEYWPEGAWVEVGDVVRFPRHGGDRYCIRRGDELADAFFGIYRDTEISSKFPKDFDVNNVRDYV